MCTWSSGFQQRNEVFTTLFPGQNRRHPPLPMLPKHKQNVSCSSAWGGTQRISRWLERGGCMQGNGLEKESWAHLPFHSSSRPLLSLLADANNRDASEAPMQDRQGSGVAVSHQKFGIFNGDRFPHACCGTLMLPWRRRRRSCQRRASWKPGK